MIYRNLLSRSILSGLDFNSFRKLAEWFDVYEYIPPANRTLHKDLVLWYLNQFTEPITHSQLFRIGFYLENVSLEKQQWIQDYNNSLTPHS